MKTYIITNDLYHFKFKINIGSIDELNVYREKKWLGKFNNHTSAIFTRWSDNRYGEFYFQPDVKAPLIAHEAVHGAMYVFYMISQPVNTDDNEDIAYLVEWFVRKINEAFVKYNKINLDN